MNPPVLASARRATTDAAPASEPIPKHLPVGLWNEWEDLVPNGVFHSEGHVTGFPFPPRFEASFGGEARNVRLRPPRWKWNQAVASGDPPWGSDIARTSGHTAGCAGGMRYGSQSRRTLTCTPGGQLHLRHAFAPGFPPVRGRPGMGSTPVTAVVLRDIGAVIAEVCRPEPCPPPVFGGHHARDPAPSGHQSASPAVFLRYSATCRTAGN